MNRFALWSLTAFVGCVAFAQSASPAFDVASIRPLEPAANLIILLIVMVVKSHAFTSLWCAYAAAASVIVLAYFWKSRPQRPLHYERAA